MKIPPVYDKKMPVIAHFQKNELNEAHPLWRLIHPAIDLGKTNQYTNTKLC
jgi:hypothetical protein